MGVISVRIPDGLEAELVRAKVKVSEVMRKDLMDLAQRLRIERKMATLAKYRTVANRPVADIVRDARNEH